MFLRCRSCHGNQNGKGGLKLSLRGQDPESDFVTLTRQLGSRRINVLSPSDSLLLRKPSMQVPHEGGRRFSSEAAEYQILRGQQKGQVSIKRDLTLFYLRGRTCQYCCSAGATY